MMRAREAPTDERAGQSDDSSTRRAFGARIPSRSRSPETTAALAAAAALLGAFAMLAALVRADGALAFDRAILRTLEPHYYDQPAHRLAQLVLAPGGEYFAPLPALIIAALVVVLAKRGLPAEALFVLLAAAVPMLLTSILKPFFPQPGLHHGADVDSYFPSGHAMGEIAVVAALALLAWPTRWRWWTLVLGVGFIVAYGASVVFLREHYPSDVLAGWCLGGAWVALLWVAFARRRIRT